MVKQVVRGAGQGTLQRRQVALHHVMESRPDVLKIVPRFGDIQAVGGMFGLYFRSACPHSYAEVMDCDKTAFNRFFHAMLAAGHYFAPSAFEAGFVSAVHSDADIAETVTAAEAIFRNW